MKNSDRLSKKEAKKLEKAQKKARRGRESHNGRWILLDILLGIIAVAVTANAIGAYLEKPELSMVIKTDFPIAYGSFISQKPTDIAASQGNAAGDKNPVSQPQQSTGPTTQEKPTTQNQTETPPADEKEEIVAAVAQGINGLKSENASFVGKKTQVIAVDLIDCSVPALTGLVNKALDIFAGEKTLEYDFTDGKAVNPESKKEEITSARAIPPTGRPFTLTAEGVVSATKEQQGDRTLYTVVLVPETSNLENPRPTHHGAACDTLDFSLFSIPGGKITKADFEYPGATVSVALDSQGRAVYYHERLEMSGVGEGTALGGLSASGSMEGYIDEIWEITWK